MPETPPVGPGSRFDFDQIKLLMELGNKTHSGHAILSAAVLDNGLQKLLLVKMQPLSNTKLDRIFMGFGPLSEFAAKIEIAHALGLIDEDCYLDLRIIKNIRDKFAHTPEEIHFRSDVITVLLKKFKAWNDVVDPFALFGQRVKACLDHMQSNFDGIIYEQVKPGA